MTIASRGTKYIEMLGSAVPTCERDASGAVVEVVHNLQRDGGLHVEWRATRHRADRLVARRLAVEEFLHLPRRVGLVVARSSNLPKCATKLLTL